MNILEGNNRKVATLIDDNEWKSRLDHVHIQCHNALQNIKIDNQKQHDYWFWLSSNDGNFNLNSAWNHI